MNPVAVKALSWTIVVLAILAVIVIVAVTGGIWPWTTNVDLHY